MPRGRQSIRHRTRLGDVLENHRVAAEVDLRRSRSAIENEAFERNHRRELLKNLAARLSSETKVAILAGTDQFNQVAKELGRNPERDILLLTRVISYVLLNKQKSPSF